MGTRTAKRGNKTIDAQKEFLSSLWKINTVRNKSEGVLITLGRNLEISQSLHFIITGELELRTERP